MAPIYPDRYKGDADLICCLSVLVPPANPLDDENLATNAVIQVPQPVAIVVDSDGSDEENQRYPYPQDPVYWTEYNNSPQRQPSPVASLDEYADPEVDRLIAALDLHDLERHFPSMYPLLCPRSGS